MSDAGKDQPSFADHFSGHANEYARFRPRYPRAFFAALANAAASRRRVWDAACGNGQASAGLAEVFDEVYASDASREQVMQAAPNPKICYVCEPAESPSLADQSVDAVLVAQALHWFRHQAFYAAVRRVAKPKAPVVAVLYEHSNVTPDVDTIIRTFYAGPIAPFWPGDRRHVENLYKTIPWPFEPIEFPVIPMRMEWTADDMLGYVATWSAVKRFMAAGNSDPIPKLAFDLRLAWGDGTRTVTWPLHRLAGRV